MQFLHIDIDDNQMIIWYAEAIVNDTYNYFRKKIDSLKDPNLFNEISNIYRLEGLKSFWVHKSLNNGRACEIQRTTKNLPKLDILFERISEKNFPTEKLQKKMNEIFDNLNK